MKLNLTIIAIALAIPTATFAQDTIAVAPVGYPNAYTSGSANVSPFTQESKRFNDWAVSAGVGVPLMQSSDLTSIKGFGAGKNLFGWSAYLSVDKAITHAFGLKLQYDKGETRQGFVNTKDHETTTAGDGARTQYDALSVLGDLNISNLLRRVDNHSPFRWALHGYAGIGTLAYRAYRQDAGPVYNQALITEIEPFKLNSLFGQAGAGVKYRATKSLDLEARGMYLVSGDETFDGARKTVNDSPSDNLINLTLGATLNLGKHESHLFWHDPLQEIYYKLDVLAERNQDVEVCKTGDADNDGVCDDWDRQLDTPAGARVDGAGVALDADLDGVIDLYDKCVTVPGPVENDGCPTTSSSTVSDDTRTLEGIEFDFDSDRILPSNTPILNNAVTYINSSEGTYNVIGGTDTRGSDAYNQNLSERRANSVKNYLIDNGVNAGKINAIGKGEKDLKYPECEPATKCPEWKNRANRRVYFEAK
ncbi:membrane protein [Kaistella solincola]|uniref:OmpA-OmpF porin, OOP family n=2 Tax=Kaistella TaxID=2782231 RepID=A0A1I3N044_9FLAO|nr:MULTISPECIES: OmpA family protein [Kaistella]KIA84222.1 membrane protein [Kaistella solincola]SFJ02266.1 OmpA-OmpF porin, OOP family [Kaistella treverensis]